MNRDSNLAKETRQGSAVLVILMVQAAGLVIVEILARKNILKSYVLGIAIASIISAIVGIILFIISNKIYEQEMQDNLNN